MRHIRFLSLVIELVLLLAWTSTVTCGSSAALVKHPLRSSILSFRAGATEVDDDSDDESDDDAENEEEEDEDAKFTPLEKDEEDDIDAALAASAVKAATKTKARTETARVATAKQAVNTKLSTPKKQKQKLLKALHVPYILRACLSPFTLFAMTKAYWASLFNLDYLNEDPSQELRSAMAHKARTGGSGSSPKGKRKMKRGQAKTLSDLPKLST